MAAFLVFLSLLAPLSIPGSAASSGYSVVTNANATRTVSWNLSDPSAFALDNVTVGEGARLSWLPQQLAWSGGTDFATNGTLDANLTASSEGLQLLANATNHIPDGNFSAQGNWTYTNAPSNTVTADWERFLGDAILGHTSGTTQVLWDSMDTTGNWSISLSDSNCTVSLSTSSTGQKQGAAMTVMNVTVPSASPCQYAGLQRKVSPVDWAGYDTLLIWVRLSSSINVTFNISAVNGVQQYWTSPVHLVQGWQEIPVDLGQLGANLTALYTVTLLFSPGPTSGPTAFSVDLDAIRLANLVTFNGTATVTQAFSKGDSTSPSSGTAVLSVDWQTTNATSVNFVGATITLAGPYSNFVHYLPARQVGVWNHDAMDVSSVVAPAGQYHVWLNLTVAANTTYAIDARMRFDNASLLFPDRRNGTYVSRVLDLGAVNNLTAVSLGLTLPPGTSANVTLLGSLSATPAPSNWSLQASWNASGTYLLGNATATALRLVAVLNTTNASLTPTFASFGVQGQHRAASGSLTTLPFLAGPSFLFWRALIASVDGAAPPAANVTFWINDSAPWVQVVPGGNLTTLTSATVQLRVLLTTSLGSYTPVLRSLSLTYDFLGPLTHVSLGPANRTVLSGAALQFTARALDSGGHANDSVSFLWSTDDPGGSVSATGLFRAGEPGPYNVTATALVPGLSLSASVSVTVLPVSAAFPLDALLLSIGGIAAAAVAGYAAFELFVRRRFAVDDIFLISRDGRLMSHHTRRLLPSQDGDILSGMLTAINSFVRDSWREENGHVRRFDFGGKTTLIERGEHVFLAAVYSGRPPGWAARDLKAFVADLEERLGAAFEKWDGSPEDLHNLRQVMDRFVQRLRYRRGRVWNGLSA